MRCLHSGLLLLCATTAGAQRPDLAVDLVNPFVGTGGHGHTFPGACVPNGLVQLSPDTRPDGTMDWDGCGGYHYSDSLIYGFSHTHLSGTGVADLCDVLLMPMSDTASLEPAKYRSHFKHSSEAANAGYYRVHLDDPDVEVELTSTARAGMHRYQFPQGRKGYVVLDLLHRDKLIRASIDPRKPTEVTGERRSSSWAGDQHLFYCIQFNRWIQDYRLDDKGTGRTGGKLDRPDTSYRAFFYFGESTEPLLVKVGISAVSIEGARKNLETEIPGWDFDAVRKQAEDAWNAKLSKVQVSGGTRDQQRTFYTALYHSYVAPYVFNDVDGNYRGMDGEVHHAEHNVYTVFSLWDTFRALHPLMTILEPDMTNDFIKTFLLHYQQGGKLPVWELWGNETNCMIGYHSVSVIADAYMKGIRGYDADLALKAMVASAMQDNPGLNAYREKGYISSEDESESVSKTLEYAYDDWCIAEMARALGRDSIADVFQKRSRNWQNLFDPKTKFFRARRNGGFIEPFDPYEVNFHFTEANAWQYSMFVPHDVRQFTAYHGGPDSLKAALDRLFNASTATTGRDQADITGLIGQYAHGNEPSHHMVYLYDEARDWWSLQNRASKVLATQYRDHPDGLAGNEDCGQMSAWLVMSALGLYPTCPGRDDYALSGTWFDSFSLASGASPFVVRKGRNDGPFVTHRSLNGRSLAADGPFVHGYLTNGDTLVLDSDPWDAGHIWGYAQWEPPTAGQTPPAAIITAPAATFRDSLTYDVTCLPGWMPAALLADPDERSKDRRTVRAYCVDKDGHKGPIVTAHFTKIDGSRKIELGSSYANQYAAGGDQALVDGLRGGADYRTGEWQGFRDQDITATVDLGNVKRLERAGLSILQDQKSWIWYPSWVEFSWSIDGSKWTTHRVENTVDRKADGAQVAEMWTAPLKAKARFVKILAKNAGPCPDWHPGKGGTTWIFSDEILIEAE